MAVCDEPKQQHDLERSDHEDEPARGVARKRELGHHRDEERTGLGIEQVAHQPLAPSAAVAQCRAAASCRCIFTWLRKQTSRPEIEEISGARELEDGERSRRALEQHPDS